MDKAELEQLNKKMDRILKFQKIIIDNMSDNRTKINVIEKKIDAIHKATESKK